VLLCLAEPCSITPDVLAHRDELAALVGDEIGRIISEQRTLEARYEELIRQRSVLKVRNGVVAWHDVLVALLHIQSHALSFAGTG